MRALLDSLYRLAGAAAALGMVATLLMVSTGIVCRPLGIYLRGTDDYAGYCMAACGFLAMAYTFKYGEHIRVSLLLERLGPRMRAAAEWISLAAAIVIVGMLSVYAIRLSMQSHEFGDISQGVDATPLWIPQLTMAVGSVILFIALLDDFVMVCRGLEPRRLGSTGGEAAHME